MTLKSTRIYGIMGTNFLGKMERPSQKIGRDTPPPPVSLCHQEELSLSLPCPNRKGIGKESLSKEATGSLGGLYQARTRKGLLFGGSNSIQIISKSSTGTSRAVERRPGPQG